MNVLGDVGGV
jgi:hypothetical protein